MPRSEGSSPSPHHLLSNALTLRAQLPMPICGTGACTLQRQYALRLCFECDYGLEFSTSSATGCQCAICQFMLTNSFALAYMRRRA